MKKILYMGICLIISILLGTALMIGVFLLPTQRMEGHLRESVSLLADEFDNSNIIYNYPTTLTGLFTDCIMLENAVYRREGRSVVQEAMEMYRGEKQEEYWTPGEALLAYLDGEPLAAEVTYGRYWHGYLVALMPLLMFFDVGELRMLGLLVQGMLCMGVVWGFYRRGRMAEGMAFCFTVLFMMPLSMTLSLSLSVCFYLMLTGVLAVLFFHEVLERIGYEWLFLIMGIAVAYFDFLTYPLVTLGIPLCVWMRQQKKPDWRTMLQLLGNCVSWGVGYGVMWAGKWVMGDLLAGSGIIRDALATLTARTGVVEQQSRLSSFFTALRENVGAVLSPPYLVMLIAAFAALCFRIAAGRRSRGIEEKLETEKPGIEEKADSKKPAGRNKKSAAGRGWEAVCYGILFLLPFGWFLVTANHSAEHWMFTFRILGISVFALLSAAESMIKPAGYSR